jgi:L-aspartate oxidase
VHELEITRAKDPMVYLDLTHLDGEQLKKRFPRIYSTCLQYNIDITTELIPIRPAAHYAMGGVRSDLEGRSNLAGLYSAGEAAATGVHGANRLASNSLLEGLVFGARAGMRMRDELKQSHARRPAVETSPGNTEADHHAKEAIGEIQDWMWQDVGIVRSEVGLRHAIKRLESLSSKLMHPKTRSGHEAQNLHTAGLLVARSALARKESRGAHYRTDFPDHDDAHYLKHSVVKDQTIHFE